MKRFIAIANRIKELRGDKSQQEFAKEIGIPFRTYQRYESGVRMPKGEAIKKIAEICDVPIDYILTGDETGLRRQLLKDVRELDAEIGAFIEGIPVRLGEIDPLLEQIFPYWTDISDDDKKAVLEYVFYKKRVEKLLIKIKGGLTL